MKVWAVMRVPFGEFPTMVTMSNAFRDAVHSVYRDRRKAEKESARLGDEDAARVRRELNERGWVKPPKVWVYDVIGPFEVEP